MTRGLVDSGHFEPVFAVESDPAAAATYAANFDSSHVFNGQIQDVSDLPATPVVVGGPPCQGFSPLNRGRDSVTSRALWREYVRALTLADPLVFVMENVPELIRTAEYESFVVEASRLGYDVDQRVLNAADFGVPQRRRRVIVIGSRLGAPIWPDPTHCPLEKVKAEGLEPWVSFRQAVKGLPLAPDGRAWHRSRRSRPEITLRYSAVPHDGGNRFQMEEELDRRDLGHLVPPCWRRKRSGTTDVGGRLWWDKPATTIRCEFYKPEKGRYLHPSEDRPITVREAARLMSFPDDFILPEDQTQTAIGRQVGNAVPPILAQALATPLVELLQEKRAFVS